MPPAPPPTPSVAPDEGGGPVTEAADSSTVELASERVTYLHQVMDEIDVEVRRRRASGDLPVALEQELDELFLEFSPVGLHGRARLRDTLSLVDRSAYVDIAVPVESQKLVGRYVKRLIRSALRWYIGFIVHQIVKFAWAVSRMFHVVVDHVEDLEAAVAVQKSPEVPASAVPDVDPGASWWAADAVAALAGVRGRVLQAECGPGGLLDGLVAAGVDAYGVDPNALLIEPAVQRRLDVRAESLVDHLEVVADGALAGMVLTGSLQWLHPNLREQVLGMASSRLDVGGILVVHSATPESWMAGNSHLISDLAPGRPLHAETWSHLLGHRGFRVDSITYGGEDRRIGHVDPGDPGATAINAAIDVVNARLLGPAEYLLVAVREQ